MKKLLMVLAAVLFPVQVFSGPTIYSTVGDYYRMRDVFTAYCDSSAITFPEDSLASIGAEKICLNVLGGRLGAEVCYGIWHPEQRKYLSPIGVNIGNGVKNIFSILPGKLLCREINQGKDSGFIKDTMLVINYLESTIGRIKRESFISRGAFPDIFRSAGILDSVFFRAAKIIDKEIGCPEAMTDICQVGLCSIRVITYKCQRTSAGWRIVDLADVKAKDVIPLSVRISSFRQ
jgi:hypothetical protein